MEVEDELNSNDDDVAGDDAAAAGSIEEGGRAQPLLVDNEHDDNDGGSASGSDTDSQEGDKEHHEECVKVLQSVETLYICDDYMELYEFILDNTDVFQDSIRRNTGIDSAVIDFDPMYFEDDDVQRLIPIIARSLGGKPSVRNLYLSIHNTYDYNLVPVLLEHIGQQLISLSLEIWADEDMEPPPSEIYDRSLSRCNLLEELDITFFETSLISERVSNPFPSIPSSLPKLRELSLVYYRGMWEPRVQLLGLPSNWNAKELRKLTLDSFAFEGQFCTALSGALANNLNLHEIDLRGCSLILGDNNVETLCAAISAAPSIRTLKLPCPNNNQFYFALVCAIGKSKSITNIILQGGDEDFGTGSNCQLITAQDFIHGVSILKNSKVLESLKFFLEYNPCVTTEALIGCINELGAKSTIKIFGLEFMPIGFGSKARRQRHTLEEGEALVEALSKNLSLTECPFSMLKSVSEQNTTRLNRAANIIFKLNKHGRRYLVEGKSKKRGVALLEAVVDDLDCIYFHLLENPALCDMNTTSTTAVTIIENSDAKKATASSVIMEVENTQSTTARRVKRRRL